MPQDQTDDLATLVQVLADGTKVELSWPSSKTIYGITRPQWEQDIVDSMLSISMA